MQRLKEWGKKYIHEWLYMHGWYQIGELQHWGHCGCCGAPIEGVFEKDWAWGLCDKCRGK